MLMYKKVIHNFNKLLVFHQTNLGDNESYEFENPFFD